MGRVRGVKSVITVGQDWRTNIYKLLLPLPSRWNGMVFTDARSQPSFFEFHLHYLLR